MRNYGVLRFLYLRGARFFHRTSNDAAYQSFFIELLLLWDCKSLFIKLLRLAAPG